MADEMGTETGETPRNFAPSSIVFCPGVCASSGLPSPRAA